MLLEFSVVSHVNINSKNHSPATALKAETHHDSVGTVLFMNESRIRRRWLNKWIGMPVWSCNPGAEGLPSNRISD